tara:strand:+ start:138 stop:620 length:483 start_codon:yes stop_codon:yes gene_type:complete
MNEQPLTHWKKTYNPDYIGAWALMDGSDNAELTVTIDRISSEMIANTDGKKESCVVAHLRGQKPMVLNATNLKSITKVLATPYVEQWAGRQITLYVKKVKAFGDVVDALRVRETISKEQLTPDHPKWSDAKAAIAAGTVTIEQIQKKYILTPQNITDLCN